MKKRSTPTFTALLIALLYFQGCKEKETTTESATAGTYAFDVDFLKHHTATTVELQDGDARVLLSADYQGRVMTSTAGGEKGNSYGWINYSLISSGVKKKQFNPVGGEERFWLGPEGGQYSIYFKKGDAFTIDQWQVPALIDTVAFNVVSQDKRSATFSRKGTLTNYSGTHFEITAERTITLLSKEQISDKLKTEIPDAVRSVAYETRSAISNDGKESWTKNKGLLSIWLLAMLTPSNQTTVIIPFTPVTGARKFITDNYFGVIPDERLIVKDSVLYFTCDGKYRSKIGLSPAIAKPIAASYDYNKNVLTIILFPVEKNGMYVNSKWEIQQQPYAGDVVNSYNDGPLKDGSQLGPFYEIESSSTASELAPDQKQEYVQSTFHLEGDFETMRTLTHTLLGVDLADIKKTSSSNH